MLRLHKWISRKKWKIWKKQSIWHQICVYGVCNWFVVFVKVCVNTVTVIQQGESLLSFICEQMQQIQIILIWHWSIRRQHSRILFFKNCTKQESYHLYVNWCVFMKNSCTKKKHLVLGLFTRDQIFVGYSQVVLVGNICTWMWTLICTLDKN